MQQPQVVTWFRVYCGLMVVIYIAVAIFGGFMAANPDMLNDPNPRPGSSVPSSADEAFIMGVMYCGLGIVLTIVFLVPFFLPRRFGAWIYDLVMICIGLTSCCFWPVTIPLLIFWIKEDTRVWFKNEQPATNAYDSMRPY